MVLDTGSLVVIQQQQLGRVFSQSVHPEQAGTSMTEFETSQSLQQY